MFFFNLGKCREIYFPFEQDAFSWICVTCPPYARTESGNLIRHEQSKVYKVDNSIILYARNDVPRSKYIVHLRSIEHSIMLKADVYRLDENFFLSFRGTYVKASGFENNVGNPCYSKIESPWYRIKWTRMYLTKSQKNLANELPLREKNHLLAFCCWLV